MSNSVSSINLDLWSKTSEKA